MTTIRNVIIDAIITLLESGGTPPPGLTVSRFPVSNIEEASLPHIAVRPGRESISIPPGRTREFPFRERILKIKLECRAKAEDLNRSPDESVDLLLAHATRQLCSDPKLGGVAIAVEEDEIEWSGDDSDNRFGLATMTFSVIFTTRKNDQEYVR